MWKRGTAGVDDLGPVYNPKPRRHPTSRSDPSARKAAVIVAKTFGDLDPNDPKHQLAGVNLECTPWD